MNHFESLPTELVTHIFTFVPVIYYYFSLNIVHQNWNQKIKTIQSRENIMNLIKRSSPNYIIAKVTYIIHNFKFTESLQYELNLLNQLVIDRHDFDIVPKRYGQPSNDSKMLKAMLMIKYNFIRFKEFFSTIDKTLELCSMAVIYGNLDILAYLHENDCPWNKDCFLRYASIVGQLECMKYLHENGCPWEEICCEYASSYGHLDCLKYLHENGCPWNELCCQCASKNGHLEVLKYLHENGCPGNENFI